MGEQCAIFGAYNNHVLNPYARTMYSLYAFNNYFQFNDRDYSLTEQCLISNALGCESLYFAIGLDNAAEWEMFQQLEQTRRESCMPVTAVYTVINLSNLDMPPSAGTHSIEDLLAGLEAGDTLDLALTFGWQQNCSNTRLDATAISFLQGLLALSSERDITISLYHHYGFWLERIEDCVRLAEAINHPRLKVTFCGYHWFARDGAALQQKLELAAPWLHLVNVSGARPAEPWMYDGGLPTTIEPVGDGCFPLVEFIEGLHSIGYDGTIGFQGYKMGGHPPVTLRRSVEAFRAAEATVIAHNARAAI